MHLQTLQSRLESIYEFEVAQRIDDFVTTDPGLVSELTNSAQPTREQVLFSQDGDDYCLSLYLDQQVYDRFRQRSGPAAMCHQQASDFCLAVEGVSHFLYLCRNAYFEREVTRLELELQAEVDKYLMLLEFAAGDSGKVLQGEVPPYSVVVSGTLPGKAMPDGSPGPGLYCAVIVKRVDEKTRAKTSINELLRD